MLYGVYALMAAGYAVMGLALLLDAGAPPAVSAGLRLLTVGALLWGADRRRPAGADSCHECRQPPPDHEKL